MAICNNESNVCSCMLGVFINLSWEYDIVCSTSALQQCVLLLPYESWAMYILMLGKMLIVVELVRRSRITLLNFIFAAVVLQLLMVALPLTDAFFRASNYFQALVLLNKASNHLNVLLRYASILHVFQDLKCLKAAILDLSLNLLFELSIKAHR